MAHPSRAALEHGAVLRLEGLHATDARAEDHSHALEILRVEVEAGLADRLVTGRDRVLDEAVHPLRVLAVDDSLGGEALHLACEMRLQARRVEPRDGRRA